ncbi:hypothetical protein T08_14488 [Trichinella sp. T8]|nr:hypothetical protein T08_14488 [Trichinella sp. T8]
MIVAKTQKYTTTDTDRANEIFPAENEDEDTEATGAVGGRPAGRLRHSISAAVVGWRELASRMSTRVQPRHALAVAEAAQLGG